MYIAYYPTGSADVKIPPIFYCLSVDPGLRNVGFRISKHYTKTKDGKRYVYKTGMVFMEVLDFSDEDFCQTLVKVTNCLMICRKLFLRLSIVVIEEQLSKLNPLVTRMGQHFLSVTWMLLQNSRLNPVIYEVSSQATKRFLGLPKGMGPSVKGPIHTAALLILKAGKDQESLTKLEEYKKNFQLHMSDSIVQLEYILKEEKYPCLKNVSFENFKP